MFSLVNVLVSYSIAYKISLRAGRTRKFEFPDGPRRQGLSCAMTCMRFLNFEFHLRNVTLGHVMNRTCLSFLFRPNVT